MIPGKRYFCHPGWINGKYELKFQHFLSLHHKVALLHVWKCATGISLEDLLPLRQTLETLEQRHHSLVNTGWRAWLEHSRRQ